MIRTRTGWAALALTLLLEPALASAQASASPAAGAEEATQRAPAEAEAGAEGVIEAAEAELVAGDPALPEATRLEAAAHYRRGQALLERGEHAEAEAAFVQAHGLVPNPILLLAVADARERAGRGPGAVEMLERYLGERADSPDADTVRARITALRAQPALLVLRSDPAGASVSIDGSAIDAVTPTEVPIAPGAHEITLHLEGYGEHHRELQAEFASRHSIEVNLEEADAIGAFGDGEPLPEPALDADPSSGAEAGGSSATLWIAGGISVGALITGTILGFLALSEESEFELMPSSASADRGERLALFADVAFGVSFVAALTGIVLALTSEEEEEPSGGAALRVIPVLCGNGAGLDARLRF
ncbi:MAG: PEGA domain-containing protein [Myxococcales bacterium]|nr:PEGA domain-containing protein [Myxococcales bacterium]